MRFSAQRFCIVIGSVVLPTFSAFADHDDDAFIQDLHNIKTTASTVPANGDVNPYGIAIVPVTTGALKKDDVLVSNFNNSSNLQGTGTTIDEIEPLRRSEGIRRH